MDEHTGKWYGGGGEGRTDVETQSHGSRMFPVMEKYINYILVCRSGILASKNAVSHLRLEE
jgi:hypothetical protein